MLKIILQFACISMMMGLCISQGVYFGQNLSKIGTSFVTGITVGPILKLIMRPLCNLPEYIQIPSTTVMLMDLFKSIFLQLLQTFALGTSVILVVIWVLCTGIVRRFVNIPVVGPFLIMLFETIYVIPDWYALYRLFITDFKEGNAQNVDMHIRLIESSIVNPLFSGMLSVFTATFKNPIMFAVKTVVLYTLHTLRMLDYSDAECTSTVIVKEVLEIALVSINCVLMFLLTSLMLFCVFFSLLS